MNVWLLKWMNLVALQNISQHNWLFSVINDKYKVCYLLTVVVDDGSDDGDYDDNHDDNEFSWFTLRGALGGSCA